MNSRTRTLVAASASDLRTLVDSSPALVLVADMSDTVVFVNEVSEMWLDRSPRDWIGETLPFSLDDKEVELGGRSLGLRAVEVVWEGNLATAVFLIEGGDGGKVEQLEAQLQRSQEEMQAVAAKLESINEDREHVEEQLNEAQQVLVEAQEDLVKREREVEDLEAENTRIRGKLDELAAKQEEERSNRVSQEQLLTLQQEMELLEEQLKESHSRAVMAESARDTAEERADRYHKLFDDLEKKAHDSTARLALAEEQLRSAEARVERYRRLSHGSIEETDVGKLEEELASHKQRAEDAEFRVLELEELLAGASSERPAPVAEFADELAARVSQAQEEAIAATARAEVAESRCQELEQEVVRLASTGDSEGNEESRAELERVKFELEQATSSLEELKAQVQAAEARCEELEEQLQSATSNDSSAELEEMRVALERASLEVEAANFRADAAEEKYNEIDEELIGLRAAQEDGEDQELRGRLEQAIKDANKAISRADAAEKQAAELQEELNRRAEAKPDRETQKLAYADQLTGLPNFNILQQYLKVTFERVNEEGGAAVLLVLDIDRFRVINDTMGQKAGDQLLKALGKRLVQLTKPNDYTLARRGEDEFIVMAALEGERDSSQLNALARGLGHSILTEVAKPFEIDGQTIHITVSVGISLFPHTANDVQELLEQAETAMYRAKETGRSRVVFYSRELHALRKQMLEMESELRRGLENDEFLVYYQPVVDLKSGKVTGLEALLRWGHPTRGLLEPREFLGLAEESGLIIPIGDRVVREVTHLARGLKKGFIALNLSTRQLLDSEFSKRCMKYIEKAGIKPSRLIVEISQTTNSVDPGRMNAALADLSQWGVGIGIDDFGTGATSLAHLNQLQPRYLKIDREFVSQTPEDRAASQICMAIANLASGLHVTCAAVGVETEAQAAFVAKCGCSYAQGNFFSAPCPATHLKEIMGRRWSI